METKEKNVNEFTIPSSEDVIVNLMYWLDMMRLRGREILESYEVPKPVGDTESQVQKDEPMATI